VTDILAQTQDNVRVEALRAALHISWPTIFGALEVYQAQNIAVERHFNEYRIEVRGSLTEKLHTEADDSLESFDIGNIVYLRLRQSPPHHRNNQVDKRENGSRTVARAESAGEV
jgi:hypothetical protein